MKNFRTPVLIDIILFGVMLALILIHPYVSYLREQERQQVERFANQNADRVRRIEVRGTVQIGLRGDGVVVWRKASKP